MNREIRVLIVDDEPLARRGLRRLLADAPDLVVAGEAANGRDAVELIERLAPELVFLDIQMPLLGGFEALEKLAAEKLPEIVFVTAYDEHAVRAFEAGALDYVLKPVDAERFHKTLDRVRRRILTGEGRALENRLAGLLAELKPAEAGYLRRVVVREKERIRLLNVDLIDRIASQGNYIEIFAGREKFLVRETMDAVEGRLDPREFLRIRRSAIVRIERIKELRPLFSGELEVVLETGARIVASRRYRKNLDALLKL
ncbi:MAG: response regulator [Acidobacteria bacterium]|nr:response regulator [Acidobacteriota bacterium]